MLTYKFESVYVSLSKMEVTGSTYVHCKSYCYSYSRIKLFNSKRINSLLGHGPKSLLPID